MEDQDIEARFVGLEARLEGVLKAQLLLGAVVESGHEDLRRQILETLPKDIAAGLREDMEAQVKALSDKVAAAIGEAIADKRQAAIEETVVKQRPLGVVISALEALEGQGDSISRR